jgi:hypothetical protein
MTTSRNATPVGVISRGSSVADISHVAMPVAVAADATITTG